MRSTAWVLREPTDSSTFEAEPALAVEEIDVAEPKGEEVLVEVRAASLCHTDVSIARGHIDERHPLVMGHEGAGVVRAVGDRVDDVVPGDHVTLGRTICRDCEFCRAGKPQLCTVRSETTPIGVLRNGETRFSKDGDPRYHCHGVSSFNEYTVVTREVATPIPDSLPFEQATLLGCGVFTGFGAATNSVDVSVGDAVAVFGAGGVGLSAVQGARLRQAGEVVAVDLVAEKLELAERLGATATVDASTADPVAEIRALTGGVDYAIEAVGSPAVVEQAVDVLRPTGTAVLVGTPPSGKHRLDVDVHDLILGERSIVGSFNGSYDLQTAIPRLAELVESGALDVEPLITDRRRLDELPRAMDALEAGTQLRQVLVP